MNSKINVLEIELDNSTAKDAMRQVVEYMKTEPVNIVETVHADILVKSKEDETLKDNIAQSDIVLAGERAVLELAEVTDRKRLQETEDQLFIRMLLRFFHKNKSRIFLLAQFEGDLMYLREYLEEYYEGISIVGSETVPEDRSADDMILNSINGAEADCVISMIPAPLQETFVVRNRILLNTRVWLGLGNTRKLPMSEKRGTNRIREFLMRRFLKREVEKEKQKRGNA